MKIQLSLIKDDIDSLNEAIERLIQKSDEDLEDILDEEGYVEASLAVTTINEIEDELTDILNENCDGLLASLGIAANIDEFLDVGWKEIKDSEELALLIYGAFKEKFERMLTACVTAWLLGDDPEIIPEGGEILSEPAKAFVENWSQQLASIMHLNTNTAIENILLQGQKEHLSIAEVSTMISDSGIRSPGYRARTVAVTEVLRAESYGQSEAMLQNPAVIEKEWHHTGAHKNKPRPNHVAMNGQRVKVDEPFSLVGANGSTYSCMCPRDTGLPVEEVANCHCIMKSIRDPDWFKKSLEERQALRAERMEMMNAQFAEENE